MCLRPSGPHQEIVTDFRPSLPESKTYGNPSVDDQTVDYMFANAKRTETNIIDFKHIRD